MPSLFFWGCVALRMPKLAVGLLARRDQLALGPLPELGGSCSTLACGLQEEGFWSPWRGSKSPESRGRSPPEPWQVLGRRGFDPSSAQGRLQGHQQVGIDVGVMASP